MTISVGPLSTQLWQGLAADTKPVHNTQPNPPKINDVFFEKDTGKWFIFDGDAWTATANGAGTTVPPMA